MWRTLVREGSFAKAFADLLLWKTRLGEPLAPTTLFGYTTALFVASDLVGLSPPAWEKRRAKRVIDKRLATHTRKQAFPIKIGALKALLRDTRVHIEVRRAALLAWLLGLRAGLVNTILVRHVVPAGSSHFRFRIVGRKGHDLGTQNVAVFLRRRGLASSLWGFLGRASRRNPDEPLLAVSAARLVRALRLHCPTASGHSLRRGAAQHLARAGASMNQIRLFLGHKFLSTTRVYVDTWPRQREVKKAMSVQFLLSRRLCQKKGAKKKPLW